jgi:hypothetical protein
MGGLRAGRGACRSHLLCQRGELCCVFLGWLPDADGLSWLLCPARCVWGTRPTDHLIDDMLRGLVLPVRSRPSSAHLADNAARRVGGRSGYRREDVIRIRARDLAAKADMAENFPGFEGSRLDGGVRARSSFSSPRTAICLLDAPPNNLAGLSDLPAACSALRQRMMCSS